MDSRHIECGVGGEILKRICTECSREFELLPKKPGLATLCPECSPAPTLLPKEAHEAAIFRSNEIIEKNFRETIESKRKAESLGQSDIAAKLEREIVTLGKMRIKP